MRLSITHRQSGKPAYNDQQLIESLKRQAPGAFDDFMSRYKHRLYGFIYHHVRNEDLAYDLLQDTCVRVYKYIGNYDESKPFTTWLFSIAINLCRSQARKARLRSSYSLDTVVNAETGATYHDTLADKNPGTEDIAGARQQLRKVNAEIERLPHKLKSALIAFAIEGNTQEECAAMLGITPKTLETRVYRARKILTDKLKLGRP